MQSIDLANCLMLDQLFNKMYQQWRNGFTGFVHTFLFEAQNFLNPLSLLRALTKYNFEYVVILQLITL